MTAFAHFNDDDPGQFSRVVTGMPIPNPDEAIIRTIIWNGGTVPWPGDALILVWSNLTNDFIGSFTAGNNSSSNCPGTTIRLNSPVPNVLQFVFYTPVENGGMTQIDQMLGDGDLVIHLDFVKYTRTPIHA